MRRIGVALLSLLHRTYKLPTLDQESVDVLLIPHICLLQIQIRRRRLIDGIHIENPGFDPLSLSSKYIGQGLFRVFHRFILSRLHSLNPEFLSVVPIRESHVEVNFAGHQLPQRPALILRRLRVSALLDDPGPFLLDQVAVAFEQIRAKTDLDVLVAPGNSSEILEGFVSLLEVCFEFGKGGQVLLVLGDNFEVKEVFGSV